MITSKFIIKRKFSIMKYVKVDQITKRMTIDYCDIPVPKQNEVLIKVNYFGINRADILQRKGLYPPPNGESEILGLECSGYIVNSNNKLYSNPVMSLLSGGGYAEYAVAHKDHIINEPIANDLKSSAGIPETYLTAYQLLRYIKTSNNLNHDSNILIHGAASGVGTSLIQFIKHVYKSNSIGICGSIEKLNRIKELGCCYGVLRSEANKNQLIKDFTSNKINAILDHTGKSEFNSNIDLLSNDGTLLIYGLMSGYKIENFDLSAILRKRLNIQCSTLRNRTIDYKTELINNFKKEIIPYFNNGTIKPIIHKVLDFTTEGITEAHRILECNENIGKVIIKINES